MRIRLATEEEAKVLGGLRWRWEHEGSDVELPGRSEFIATFVAWARANSATHLGFLAIVDDDPIGMAWLALTSRPPTPSCPRRADGDVQSVYVVPQLRNRGVGGRLLAAIFAEARERGLTRLSVQAGERPRSFYQRLGFGPDPYVLHLGVPTSARLPSGS